MRLSLCHPAAAAKGTNCRTDSRDVVRRLRRRELGRGSHTRPLADSGRGRGRSAPNPCLGPEHCGYRRDSLEGKATRLDNGGSPGNPAGGRPTLPGATQGRPRSGFRDRISLQLYSGGRTRTSLLPVPQRRTGDSLNPRSIRRADQGNLGFLLGRTVLQSLPISAGRCEQRCLGGAGSRDHQQAMHERLWTHSHRRDRDRRKDRGGRAGVFRHGGTEPERDRRRRPVRVEAPPPAL